MRSADEEGVFFFRRHKQIGKYDLVFKFAYVS